METQYSLKDGGDKCLYDALEEKRIGLMEKGRNVPENPKDLIRVLRGAQAYHGRIKPDAVAKVDNYMLVTSELQGYLRDIEAGNPKIEKYVKADIMGIEKNAKKRMAYSLKEFFSGLSGEVESAEDLITKQLDKVDKISRGLDKASECLDIRTEELELYHQRIESELNLKADGRSHMLEYASGLMELLSEFEKVRDNPSDFSEKLRSEQSHRQITRELKKQMNWIKRANKAIILFSDEKSFLSNLQDVFDSHVCYIQDMAQDARYMSRHLKNVMGIYLDMMRIQRMDTRINQELEMLFAYTSNMNKALNGGIIPTMRKATTSPLFSANLETRTKILSDLSQDLASVDSESFEELDKKACECMALKKTNERRAN